VVKVAVVILLALVILVATMPSLLYGGLVLAGKGNGCTVKQALEINKHKAALTAAKDDILNRSKKIKSDGNLDLYDTPYGLFWAPKGSQYILPFNLAEERLHIYGEGARKGDIVLDCGANVGTFARFALNQGAAKVIAIEPAPDNIEALKRNFAKEIADGRLVVVPKGVWDKDDVLELRVDPENQAADSFVIQRPGATSTIKVPLTTIDQLVAELGLPKVDFIKMDIEGAEVKALQGAKQTLAKHHPRMGLSVYHQDDHPVEVPKAALEGWPGYKVECGPCAKYENRSEVRPEILWFH
jgi:FkbM family methyltransferase